MRRVVVTGMGALTPIGNNTEQFINNIRSGVSGANLIRSFNTERFKTKFACELKNFDAGLVLDKQELRKFDLFTRYALVAVHEAVAQAQLPFQELDRTRAGVIWGSGNGGLQSFEQEVMDFANGDGTPRFSPYFIPRIIVDIAAGVISMKYGFKGVNFATVSACATSNTAIIEAFNYIRWNKADVIITGGSEAPVAASSIGGFNASKALSTNNADYLHASKPFDIARDGFVLGEGAGALILEELSFAQKRGAVILAEIVGGGMAADAYHLTSMSPDGEGAYLGMKLALEEAGIKPGDIDYLNAHATSTPSGDISELHAIANVFQHHQNLHISATKSMTGHLLGAAGAVESIVCIAALQHQFIPPTINTQIIEPGFTDKFHFPIGKSEEKEILYAMNNTFGFGGHVATTIFKKFTDAP